MSAGHTRCLQASNRETNRPRFPSLDDRSGENSTRSAVFQQPARDEHGTRLPGVFWEHRVEIKNKSPKTLRNVSVTTEHIGLMPIRPRDAVFDKIKKTTCDLNPGCSELVPVMRWHIPKELAGNLAGPSAWGYGPIKITASADDAVPSVRVFQFNYETDQMLFDEIPSDTSITKDAAIDAKYLRAHFIRTYPFGEFVDAAYRLKGQDSHDTDCDFLLEVFLVNTTNNPVTIQKIVADVQLDGAWKPLDLMDKLNDYQLEFPDKLVDSPEGGVQIPKIEDLVPNLAESLRGVVLTRGIGYQGWLRFRAHLDTKYLTTAVTYRAAFIDALGHEHPIQKTDELLKDGIAVHSREVWRERFKRL